MPRDQAIIQWKEPAIQSMDLPYRAELAGISFGISGLILVGPAQPDRRAFDSGAATNS